MRTIAYRVTSFWLVLIMNTNDFNSSKSTKDFGSFILPTEQCLKSTKKLSRKRKHAVKPEIHTAATTMSDENLTYAK